MGRKPTKAKLRKLKGFVELVGRRGRRTGTISRLYGVILEMNDGKRLYLALRKREEIFRSGEFSVNSAESKGVACWAIDESDMLDFRAKNVDFVGVWEYESDDKYVAPIAAWDRAKFLNYESRGGALQRYLPITEFLHIMGKTKF